MNKTSCNGISEKTQQCANDTMCDIGIQEELLGKYEMVQRKVEQRNSH